MRSVTPQSNLTRNRSNKSIVARTSSEKRRLALKKPETFYINTITNNYYQVKKKNAQLAR